MGSRLFDRLRDCERHLRTSFGNDISTPAARRKAWWNFQLFDHAFLRVWWTNFDEIAPGVYRSNQPSPGRIKSYARRGITAILSLRGSGRTAPFLLEEEACKAQGIDLITAALPARFPAQREALLDVIAKLREMPKPFLMHCKSGADRAGFAATLYLAVIEGRPIKEARAQLSIRYLHLSTTPTGIIDHFFDLYEARLEAGEIPLETWIATEYDPDVLLESWQSRGGRVRK